VDTAIALLSTSTVIGAVAGQPAKRARRLARDLAADRQPPSAELRTLLDSRVALVLNYCSAVILVGVIVDMLIKPGS
jgi:hypothetical protein